MPTRTKPDGVRYQPKPVQPGSGCGRASQVQCSARSEKDTRTMTTTRSRSARSVPGRARASSPWLAESGRARLGRLVVTRARALLAQLGPMHSGAVSPGQCQDSARARPAAPDTVAYPGKPGSGPASPAKLGKGLSHCMFTIGKSHLGPGPASMGLSQNQA